MPTERRIEHRRRIARLHQEPGQRESFCVGHLQWRRKQAGVSRTAGSVAGSSHRIFWIYTAAFAQKQGGSRQQDNLTSHSQRLSNRNQRLPEINFGCNHVFRPLERCSGQVIACAPSMRTPHICWSGAQCIGPAIAISTEASPSAPTGFRPGHGSWGRSSFSGATRASTRNAGSARKV